MCVIIDTISETSRRHLCIASSSPRHRLVIAVVQDSVETALNSSGDVFFTATAEEFDRKGKGEEERQVDLE